MTELVNLSESTVVKAGDAFCLAQRESIALTEVNIEGDLDTVLDVERGRDEEPPPLLDDVRHAAGLPV